MMFEINSITEIWRGGATGHSVKGYIYVDTRKTKKKEERDNIVVLLRKGTSSWGGEREREREKERGEGEGETEGETDRQRQRYRE